MLMSDRGSEASKWHMRFASMLDGLHNCVSAPATAVPVNATAVARIANAAADHRDPMRRPMSEFTHAPPLIFRRLHCHRCAAADGGQAYWGRLPEAGVRDLIAVPPAARPAAAWRGACLRARSGWRMPAN